MPNPIPVEPEVLAGVEVDAPLEVEAGFGKENAGVEDEDAGAVGGFGVSPATTPAAKGELTAGALNNDFVIGAPNPAVPVAGPGRENDGGAEAVGGFDESEAGVRVILGTIAVVVVVDGANDEVEPPSEPGNPEPSPPDAEEAFCALDSSSSFFFFTFASLILIIALASKSSFSHFENCLYVRGVRGLPLRRLLLVLSAKPTPGLVGVAAPPSNLVLVFELDVVLRNAEAIRRLAGLIPTLLAIII